MRRDREGRGKGQMMRPFTCEMRCVDFILQQSGLHSATVHVPQGELKFICGCLVSCWNSLEADPVANT